jgi:MFS transporter, ACS family, tartrate transporter
MQAMDSLEKRTIGKVKKRIIPYIFLLYIVAYLDRVNIGYAALDMNKALGITSSALGMISGIFFLGYFIFEVPSNILMHRVGARKWIARILVSWGIVVIITTWAQGATHLYVLRFILGLAEAGFFPGIILYLTYWFPQKERARAVAMFMSALAVANIIGAPLSTWIMDNVHWSGMPGWRWLFFLEGVPAVILGYVTLKYLTDRPKDAKWLTDEEKKWLIAELNKENQGKSMNHSLGEIFKSGAIWRFALVYLTLNIGQYGINFWLPTIIKAFSSTVTNTQVGLIAMIPYIAGGICMNIWSRHSDKTGERRWHAGLPLLIGAVGMAVSGMVSNPFAMMTMISLTVVGIYCFYGPFWSLPTAYLGEAAAAVGIATINSVGNLGGFVGPYMIGYLKDATGSVHAGLYFLCASLIISAFLVITAGKQKEGKTLNAGANAYKS